MKIHIKNLSRNVPPISSKFDFIIRLHSSPLRLNFTPEFLDIAIFLLTSCFFCKFVCRESPHTTLFLWGSPIITATPAAARTIYDFLSDTATKPQDYDLILTGDLGFTGSKLLHQILEKEHNIDIAPYHNDCGMLIYDLKKQDANSGGSGCGCAGSVLCSHILKKMRKGELHKVFLVATGALMSPTSNKQGNPIPSIAHGVLLEV